MEHVSIALHTPLEGFANDLCDVLKLFFAVDGYWVNQDAPGAEPLIHTYCEEPGGNAHSRFAFRGQSYALLMPLPQATGFSEAENHFAVALKRVRKRLCKKALYGLLTQLTGKRPPWGSLTGIRPTRLLYQALAEGRAMDEAVRYLQDAFDVSDEKAQLLKRIVLEQQKLPAPSPDEADVYVSIPFCRTRCAYCSFPGEAVGGGRLIPPYLDALLYEMRRGAELLSQTGLRLRALYVGGGTPSALDESAFARLMEEIMRLFPGAREYTVEAGRPDTITRGKLQTLKRMGVGRISINPQTMNDETLRAIGRGHTAGQTAEAFGLARELGFTDINMDVIAGLPGEDAAAFERTMEAILRMRPDSLTVHTLAIKRSSRLNLERYPLPEGDIAAEMVRLGEQAANALGLAPYYLYRQKYMAGQQQNVGYARPGAACLYNVDIMEENTSILAMGAGAISKRVFPDRELRIVRAPNVSNVSVYIDRVQEMARRKEALFLETEA
ncbi:MAG: coproporphyrinogen dehydrogenase HemZ [Clostridiales bacterium]|nr:coproporphyrinogen dehydrogenase HemZ [Clostridiales bacterium]MDO4349347.1 coproporphyrinogen dehydrogenase HemZ [Eubacteriales bacterium]MDY4007370.1 coproporphyrinogen dehydrogenase HemZ [Candidatus Limiplasma sp.]